MHLLEAGGGRSSHNQDSRHPLLATDGGTGSRHRAKPVAHETGSPESSLRAQGRLIPSWMRDHNRGQHLRHGQLHHVVAWNARIFGFHFPGSLRLSGQRDSNPQFPAQTLALSQVKAGALPNLATSRSSCCTVHSGSWWVMTSPQISGQPSRTPYPRSQLHVQSGQNLLCAISMCD